MLDARKKEPQAKIISVKKDKNGGVVLFIEYSFYRLRGGGYFVPINYGYQEGMKKERERIVKELKSYADRYKTERIAIDKVVYMIEKGESV